MSQALLEYQRQLWNVCNDDVYDHNVMNCTYTNDLKHDSQMLHVDPHVGNQSVGISVTDPDNRRLIAESAMHGNQNDSKHPMNLQNHDYNMAEPMYDTISPLSQRFWLMQHPHNCRARSENNIVHTFNGYSDCQTWLCTVQLFNRYWEGTDINTRGFPVGW